MLGETTHLVIPSRPDMGMFSDQTIRSNKLGNSITYTTRNI